MKYFLSFIVILILFSSCKKEKELSEAKYLGYKSNTVANVLVLEVEEDVNYAYEFSYKNGITFDTFPILMGSGQYSNSLNSYLYHIVSGENMGIGFFRLVFPGGYCRHFLEFPGDYHPDNYFIVPKEQLIHTPNKKTLEESNARIIFERNNQPNWDKNAYWKPIWEKINDLNVVIQYRNAYPQSDVGFMTLEDEYGSVIKHYIFLVKSVG